MPIRASQHQLEDRSREKFKLALPGIWVKRDKDKDYGIDVEVEIFDDDGGPTGLVFLAQLKATASSKVPIVRKVRLKIAEIEYCQSLDLPVLLARYSDHEDRWYVKWLHEVDLYNEKRENAKSKAIAFDDSTIWTEETAARLVRELKKIRLARSGAFTLPISLHIDAIDDVVCGMQRAVFMANFRKHLSQFSALVAIDADKEAALAWVQAGTENLSLCIAGVASCTFHRAIAKSQGRGAEDAAADTLLCLGQTLVSLGQVEMAALVFLDNGLVARFLRCEQLLANSVPALVASSRGGEFLGVVGDLIEAGEGEFVEAIAILAAAATVRADPNRLTAIQGLLIKSLNKCKLAGDSVGMAIGYYNLGNHFRSRGMAREALRNYARAKRFDTRYGDRPYFCSELGGVLFESGRYACAVKAYRRALDLGGDVELRPLYADALMSSGQYRAARESFGRYFETRGTVRAEWRLKAACLDELMNSTGIESQKRRSDAATVLAGAVVGGRIDSAHQFHGALDLDCLCGLAWFNLGVEYSRLELHENAQFAFVMCGLIQRGDVEAWVNGTICCLNYQEGMSVLPLVVEAAYSYNGDEYAVKLYSTLTATLSGNSVDAIASVIEEIIARTKRYRDGLKVRFLNEDGSFQELTPRIVD